ncbi:GAF domain-containing protein [Microlunatus capsulatus]|uniref:GAF domain-containing protein n=1 Tax=Microlunatus capsulatus TaxID=99117 RepID=UPI0031CEB08E
MRRLADRYLAAVVGGVDDDDGRALLPAVLARACVAVLPVQGAGLGLVERLRVPLGGSDDEAVRAERLQTTLGEGPCLDAIEAGEAVAVDEPELARRWPAYHRALIRQTSFRSVASLPLRTPGHPPIGALDLYSDAPAVDAAARGAEVQTDVADQIGGLLLDAPLVRAGWTDEPVAAWLAGPGVARRMEVWRAVGMVVHDLGTTQQGGLDLLRGFAVDAGSSLDAVPARLTAAELAPADLRRGAGAPGATTAPPPGTVPGGAGVGEDGDLPPGVSSLDARRRRGSGRRPPGRP